MAAFKLLSGFVILLVSSLPLQAQGWPRWKASSKPGTESLSIDTASFSKVAPEHYFLWVAFRDKGEWKKIPFEFNGNRYRFVNPTPDESDYKLIEPSSFPEEMLIEAQALDRTLLMEKTDELEGSEAFWNIPGWIQGTISETAVGFVKFLTKDGKRYLYYAIAPKRISNMSVWNLHVFERSGNKLVPQYWRSRIKMQNREMETIQFGPMSLEGKMKEAFTNFFKDNSYVVGELPMIFAPEPTPKTAPKPEGKGSKKTK